jgi:hypothetical protein
MSVNAFDNRFNEIPNKTVDCGWSGANRNNVSAASTDRRACWSASSLRPSIMLLDDALCSISALSRASC